MTKPPEGVTSAVETQRRIVRERNPCLETDEVRCLIKEIQFLIELERSMQCRPDNRYSEAWSDGMSDAVSVIQGLLNRHE